MNDLISIEKIIHEEEQEWHQFNNDMDELETSIPLSVFNEEIERMWNAATALHSQEMQKVLIALEKNIFERLEREV